MRNLTIKRAKRFVASLTKVKVYIEDATSSEIKINDIPCRKLGELKNGEEKVFQIDECAAKVFVIADKLSKNYCNEYYQLSEGQEDVFLSGQNKFNPARGNAFQFDNNNSEEIVANRKRNTRKGSIVLISALIIGFVIGYFATSNLFSGKEANVKAFSSDGMTITLTDEFAKGDVENYTVAYGSRDVAVFAIKEEFDLLEGFEDYTLDQYLDLVLQANSLSSDNVKKESELTCFIYDFTNPNTGDTYRYFSYVYKSSDAFWTVQFAVLSEHADAYEQQIVEWANSVKFSN